MTPERLNELADLADPEKLWTLPGREILALTGERKQQLQTGVALRRYATHVRRLQELLGTGKSLLITPLSPNGTHTRTVPTPADDERDAVRYRTLREQDWDTAPLCVVVNPKETVRLGTDCPSRERLDEMVDALRAQWSGA